MEEYHFHGSDSRDQRATGTPGDSGVVSGLAGSTDAPPGVSFSMTSPATRHALNPPYESFHHLLSGIDSLDLGLHVDWGNDWPEVRKLLEKSKDKAQGTDGIVEEITPDRKYLFLPGGKPPNYRYHLQFNEYHLYIAKSDQAKNSPNVYLSINAETLWKKGPEYALDLVVADLKYFCGELDRVKPSRLDLSTDFKLAAPLTLPFLQEHAVCRSRDIASHLKGETLETCYFGSAAAPIRLRIYDKGKEVLKRGKKGWFADFWNTDDFTNIWRVEFQLRRPALKQFKVNHLGDLWQKSAGIWQYLTGTWFTLRLPDNDKAERRTLHPWWQEVQACGNRLGESREVPRELNSDMCASAQWYIAHIAGCLPAFAARVNIRDFREAILKLGEELYHHWGRKDFESEFIKRAIKLGNQMGAQGEDHGNS